MTSIEFLNDRIEKLEARKVENSISDEARAEIEAAIAGLQQAIADLQAARDAAAEGEEDHTAELESQMREILARINALEDSKENETKNESTMNEIQNSKKYEENFMKMVQNCTSRDEFKSNLKNLAVENGITFTDSDITNLLPAAILQEVNDLFVGHRHRLLELVDWTGLPVFKAFWEGGNDMAKTWPSPLLGQEASEDPKTQQELTFAPITIRPQFVYKYIVLDKEVVKASEGENGTLLRYIVREPLDRLLCTIEGYILNGNANNFIAPAQTAVVVDANSVPQYHALNYLPYNSGLIAVMTPAAYISLKQGMLSTYGYYITDDMFAKDFMGVDEIVMTPPAFTQTNADGVGVWFMDPRAYKMVGDRRPDQYEAFNLEKNQQQYLMEMWIGGGCVTPAFIELETGE